MLYLENLKYKEQVEDLAKKGIVKKNEDEIMHFQLKKIKQIY